MQYLTLNALMKKYNKKKQVKCGFTVLGFPCNQFGLQEPGKDAYEIKNGLKHVRPGHGFKPKFPMFGKIEVNGANEHKIYTFLKERCPDPNNLIDEAHDVSWSPAKDSDISWNFEKVLIDHEGQPFRRYAPSTKPEEISKDIQTLVKRCKEF